MKIQTKDIVKYLVLIIITMGGGFSLLLFGLFLLGYTFSIIKLDYSTTGFYVWDTLLCLIFFAQHSIMIRKGFRSRLESIVPQPYYGALFTAVSSAALIILVLFWQESSQTLINLRDESRLLAYGIFFTSMIAMMWSMCALRSFDMFGIQSALANIRASHVATMSLTIRGPYRWVRHPLYFLILIMIWSCPDVTMDRLLFNILFTAWVVLGTILEERDLLAEFGVNYQNYQSKVPMLIPWKLHKPFPFAGIKNGFG